MIITSCPVPHGVGSDLCAVKLQQSGPHAATDVCSIQSEGAAACCTSLWTHCTQYMSCRQSATVTAVLCWVICSHFRCHMFAKQCANQINCLRLLVIMTLSFPHAAYNVFRQRMLCSQTIDPDYDSKLGGYLHIKGIHGRCLQIKAHTVGVYTSQAHMVGVCRSKTYMIGVCEPTAYMVVVCRSKTYMIGVCEPTAYMAVVCR